MDLPLPSVLGLLRVARAIALTAAATTATATTTAVAASNRGGDIGAPGRRPPPEPPAVLVLAPVVRDSINAIFLRNNQHWDELGRVNTLTQMLGTGPPTQREYLGCLIGRANGDTVAVTDWAAARNLKQLQFAVTGSCDGVHHLVGTWHTHPYRAAPDGHALKEPDLSKQDLATFAAGHDRAVLVAWDVDSLDAAVRAPDGSVRHPATVVVGTGRK